MHEYSIVSALIARVTTEAEAHGATRVATLNVRIGELSGVEAGLIATAFEMFRERTLCAGAELIIHPVPARWACPSCGETIATGGTLRCEPCGAPERLVQGDEIYLDRIELEVP